MRLLLLLAPWALAACLGPEAPRPTPLQGPLPEVLVRSPLPPGTSLGASVGGAFADERGGPAVRTGWRAALGQSARFAVLPQPQDGGATLVLSLDPETRTAAAALEHAETTRTIATLRLGPGGEADDLFDALDRLAWACRTALGESCDRPLPVAQLTSSDARAVLAVADADALVQTGAFSDAYATLREARRRDGGAPFILEPLAALELLRGAPDRALAICREALGYEARCSPTVQHKLARTLLLAKAAREPARAGQFDRELATLAAVARRERPHDAAPVYTAARSHNCRAEFRDARPLLEQLHRAYPERGFVSYHLGWSCLGSGDPAAAADHLRAASMRLPTPWLLLPWAIALHESGRHEELGALLTRMRQERRADDDTLEHQLLRMQAARALLHDDRDAARELLVDDLRWLAAHPTVLDARLAEFAEAGAVLVRLGSAPVVPALVAAVQRLPIDAATRDAAAFVGGMDQVLRTGRRADGLEATLSRDGDSAWGTLLEAFAHEQQGEVGAMQAALARAARMSDSPMTKALLARSLRAVGKHQEADLLSDTLRREMLALHLRRPCEHPLFGPELAFAFLLR